MNTNNFKGISFLVVVIFGLCGPLAYASSATVVQQDSKSAALVENDPETAPDVLVSKATDALLHRINKASAEDKALGLEFYEHLVALTVGPFVDFETIAFRVMGRSVYDQASEDQRVAFVEAFKRSLISTYAKGISTYDNQTITVSPYEGIQTKNGVSRARVELQIQPKGGKPFPIIYSMFKDESRGWMLENMHLDNVNVGSTFRSQFNQAMKDKGNDLDKVIQAWGAGS
jgi:phospholipid transport system substrate-binding protein